MRRIASVPALRGKARNGVKQQMLTDVKIRNLQPAPAVREYADGNGLYLAVQSSGVKSWALRYRFAGKTAKRSLPQRLTTSRCNIFSVSTQSRCFTFA